MRVGHLRAIALSIGVSCNPAFALESYVLYDNFSASPISPDRWSEVERVRRVEGAALRLVQRDWGSTTSDAGTQAFNWSEPIARPGPITQLKANVRVNAIDMTGCAPNPSPTYARARVIGAFFSSGNPSIGSRRGDVMAQIVIQRDSRSADAPGVLQVTGGVFACDSSDCSSSVYGMGLASLGTAIVGANTLVQIEWDRANKQFLFSQNQGTPIAIPYTVDDSASPAYDVKTFETRTQVASCSSAPRAFGTIDAKFDNVSVNASGKP